MERLLERESELAALERLLDRGGGMLVVEGGAGVGKTALVEMAWRQAVDRGWERLRARGSQLEARFAFGVVRQLLERRLAGAAAGEREALLAGPAAAAAGSSGGALRRGYGVRGAAWPVLAGGQPGRAPPGRAHG